MGLGIVYRDEFWDCCPLDVAVLFLKVANGCVGFIFTQVLLPVEYLAIEVGLGNNIPIDHGDSSYPCSSEV